MPDDTGDEEMIESANGLLEISSVNLFLLAMIDVMFVVGFAMGYKLGKEGMRK